MASIVIAGDTSGSVTISAPAIAGTPTLTLPTTSGTLVVTGGAQTVQFAAGSAASPSITFTGDTNTGIFSPTADTIAFSEGGVESMRIDSSGNLNMSTVGGKVNFATTSSATVNYIGVPADGFSLELACQRGASQPFVYKLDFANGHIWSTAGSERMRIDSSGNVGIGTTSPSVRLQVNGGVNSAHLVLTGTAGRGLRISTSNPNGQNDGTVIYNAQDTENLGQHIWQTGGTERMRIDSSGNLLVGATSLQTFSGVTADHALVGTTGNGRWVTGFRNNGNSNPWGLAIGYSAASPNNTTQAFLWAEDSSGLRFNVRSNGGIGNYQANDANLSDEREKTNIQLAGFYLDKICSIPVKTFNYIDQNLEEDDGLTLGVIAQDVQKVAPELISESNWGTEDKPKMRLAIYQTDLQYALMKAIQELNAKVEAQAAEIAALKGAN